MFSSEYYIYCKLLFQLFPWLGPLPACHSRRDGMPVGSNASPLVRTTHSAVGPSLKAPHVFFFFPFLKQKTSERLTPTASLMTHPCPAHLSVGGGKALVALAGSNAAYQQRACGVASLCPQTATRLNAQRLKQKKRAYPSKAKSSFIQDN